MSFNRIASCAYLSVIFISVAMLMIMTGCTPDIVTYATEPTDGFMDQGGDGIVLQLPFAAGVEKQCTQGAFGTFSHSSDSTKFDIDLEAQGARQWLVDRVLTECVLVSPDWEAAARPWESGQLPRGPQVAPGGCEAVSQSIRSL